MADTKKSYEKPMIQDLGQLLTGSADISPMGYCSGGDSPSEPITVCQGGAGVLTECVTGSLYSINDNVCQAGGLAVDFCQVGNAFPDCSYGGGV